LNENQKTWVRWFVLLIVALIPTVIALVQGKPAPNPDIPPPPDFVPSFGWTPEPAEVEKSVARMQAPDFKNTPAGKVVMQGEPETLLYRAVRKHGGFAGNKYPNKNQKSVGSCVGFGFMHGAQIAQATAISAGEANEWKDVAPEPIYAGSRIDIGGGGIQGDGSVGAWAAEYLGKFGFVSAEKHGPYDLTEYSESRCRTWGSQGNPAAITALAKEHPFKSVARVKSVAEARKAIAQGYPIAVCSDVGFAGMRRDSQGFIRRSGVWAHCMCFIGIRDGARPGVLCLNSWGDTAHTGPVYPEDMPVAAFWIDDNTVDQMLRQNDSFALSGVVGFPARELDWFIHVRPKGKMLCDLQGSLLAF